MTIKAGDPPFDLRSSFIIPSQTTYSMHAPSTAISDQASEVTALITSLKDYLPRGDSEGSYDRERLKEAAERLSIALETPGDTVQRIAYYVRMSFVFVPYESRYLNGHRDSIANLIFLNRAASADYHCSDCQ